MAGLPEELLKRATTYRKYAARLEQMAKELRAMEVAEPPPPGYSSTSKSPKKATKKKRTKKARTGKAGGGPPTGVSRPGGPVEAALEMIRRKKGPIHLTALQDKLGGQRSRLQKALDRGVRRGELKKTAPATYDKP